MQNRNIVRFFLIVLEIFGLMGMPALLYADDLESQGNVNVSALVPSAEEEEEVVPAVGGGGVPDTTPPQISDIVVGSVTSRVLLQTAQLFPGGHQKCLSLK